MVLRAYMLIFLHTFCPGEKFDFFELFTKNRLFTCANNRFYTHFLSYSSDLCKGAYKTIQVVYSFCSPINAQVNNYLVFLRALFLRLMPKAPLTTAHAPIILRGEKMVGLTGFEPATSRSRTERSTKLSHNPTKQNT